MNEPFNMIPAVSHPAAYDRVRKAWDRGQREFYYVGGSRIAKFIAVAFDPNGYLSVNARKRYKVQFVCCSLASARWRFSQPKNRSAQ